MLIKNLTTEKSITTKEIALIKKERELRSCVENTQKIIVTKNSIVKSFAGLNKNSSNFNSSPAAEVLQVLGRIVVKKVKQASLQYIQEYIFEKLLKCKETTQKLHLKALCEVVKKADLHTILTKPDTFMNAFIIDLLDFVQTKLLEEMASNSNDGRLYLNIIFKDLKDINHTQLLAKLIDAWKVGGAKAMATTFRSHTQTLLLGIAKERHCPSDDTKTLNYRRSLWVVLQCLTDSYKEVTGGGQPAKQKELINALNNCNYEEKVNSCNITKEPEKIEVSRLSSLQLSLLTASLSPKPQAKDIAKPALQLYFHVIKDVVKKSVTAPAQQENVLKLFGGVEKTFLGVIVQDWVEVTVGVTSAMEGILGLLITDKKKKDDRIKRLSKLTKLVAAIGQYANTYKADSQRSTPKTLEQKQKERQQIIENLMEATVNRSGRESGWVFSLGGTLGLTFAGRYGLPNSDKDVLNIKGNGIPLTLSSPISLTLGMSLQYFCANDYGFHLQLSIFDIGQYVQFREQTVDVALPEVQQAISFNLFIGGWFGKPNFPIVYGAHIGLSPFLGGGRSNALYFGVLFGIYIPFFDF